MPLSLEIVTPEARVYADMVDTVVIPTVQNVTGLNHHQVAAHPVVVCVNCAC